MELQYRNEIIKLFKNIKLSGLLNKPYLYRDDIDADIVLSSLYMLLKHYDYPIHFDNNSNGCFVPDIVTYQSPPLFSPQTTMDFKDIMSYENSMEQHIIGIEHFKIGNFSFENSKGKIVNKLSEFEARLYKENDSISERTNDLDKFKIKDKQDIYTSFEKIYGKHYSKINRYEEKIRGDNLLGHAVHPDGSIHSVPIWFLIECDDCMFINGDQCEIPIFLTEKGMQIIKNIGIPDGLIFYGRSCISAISKDILHKISVEKDVIFAYPQKEQYLRFQNNEWGKTINHYVKIV